MPQSVTVPIAFGNEGMEASCNGDQPQDCSLNKKPEPPPPPQSQTKETKGRGQGLQATATPSPPSNSTAQSLHHDLGRKQTQPCKSANPEGRSTAKGSDSHSLNNFHNSMAEAAPAPIKIKRTKKVAKPRSKAKAKASSSARKRPPKKNKSDNTSPPSETELSPCGKSNAGRKAADKEKVKNKNPKSPSKSKSPKKKAKKRSRDYEDASSSTANKNQKASSTKQGKGDKSSPQSAVSRGKKQKASFPTIVTRDAQLRKVVSDLVDMVADEIHCCASVFGPGRATEVSERKYEDPEETSSASAKTSGFRASNFARKEQKDPSKPSYSVNISAEGDIHLVNKDACSLEPSEDGISAKPATHSNSETERPSQQLSSDPDTYDARPVVTAVRRFVLEVYYPFLVSAKKRMGNNSPDANRVRISTLLAIREMLILNGDRIFSFSSSEYSPTERAYLSHVFANAIVRNTARRFHLRHTESSIYVDLVHATQNYDARSEDFRFSLAQADFHSVYAYPDGRKVGQEESILAKVGFNYARSRHPLLNTNTGSLTHPIPTACAAFQIDVDVAEATDETKDDMEVLESLKKELRGKQEAS